MAIPLYDDFADPLGQFHNYLTYGTSLDTALAGQKHVDLRSFLQRPLYEPYNIFQLDLLPMSVLDTLTMEELEGFFVLREGENWSAGTVAPQSDRANFNGISLTCNTGTTSTSSVMDPIDISQFTATNDYISLTCPALPSQVTLASSFLDLTSNSTGNFSTGPTDSLAFSSATTTAIGTDTEFRWPVSTLTHVDHAAIRGVRLRITTSANVTFRALAIRVMAATWLYGLTDQNTLYGYLGPTVPPTGSLTQSYTFPGPGLLPSPTLYPSPDLFPSSGWPAVFFSDGGTYEPLPVAMDVGIHVHAGSGQAVNAFNLYFREFSMVPYDMSDLETMTMSDLAALGTQPEFVPGDIHDPTTSHYVLVSIKWGLDNSVSIERENGYAYSFAGPTLTTGQDYYFIVTIHDNSVRVKAYPLDLAGNVDFSTPLFDSLEVNDPYLVPRRNGRFGWYAEMHDGDAFIYSLRPREVVYHEYRSTPFVTETPTIGARLYPETSPAKQLYSGSRNHNSALVTFDNQRSKSGQCLRIQTIGNQPFGGLISNLIRFEDFLHTTISFDLLTPPEITVVALLQGEGRLHQLYMPHYAADRWTRMTIPLETIYDVLQPGPYNLLLVQLGALNSAWYVDNLSVALPSVAWEGRQAPRMGEAPWLGFNDAINEPYNGLVVGRGNRLQIRGEVLTQAGQIYGLKLLPQYAQLGNLTWTGDQPSYGSPPTPLLAAITSGKTVTVEATGSTFPNGSAAYHWNFGDGKERLGVGPLLHTYKTSGDYVITLTVIDALDRQASVTEAVSV